MELRSLRYFVTLADELHFGRAAKRLYITQPGLSQGIKTLERQIGLPLFERRRQRVALTRAGHTLLPAARKALTQADEVDRLARQLSQEHQDTLRLSHSLSSGVGLPFRLTAAFRKRHPDVTIRTATGRSDVNIEQVRSREVDASFVHPPVELDEELAFSALTREAVVVAAPENHPLTRVSALGRDDVVDQPLVFFPKVSGGLPRAVLDAIYGNVARPSIVRIESDEPHMLAAVAENAGIGLLTESAASMLNVPGVVIRSFARQTTVPLGIAWRRDNTSPALRVYLTFAHDFARTRTPQVA